MRFVRKKYFYFFGEEKNNPALLGAATLAAGAAFLIGAGAAFLTGAGTAFCKRGEEGRKEYKEGQNMENVV